MDEKITKEDRIEAQRLLREVLLILSDVGDIERRIDCIKVEITELYKKLDNIADGEN